MSVPARNLTHPEPTREPATPPGDDSIIAGTTNVDNVFNGGAGNDKLRGRRARWRNRSGPNC